MTEFIKACPHCGYISPDQPGHYNDVAVPDFSTSNQVQIIVEANPETLDAAVRQNGFTARLCDYSDHNGMTDLDQIAAETLVQFSLHMGYQNATQPVVTDIPITLRAALSHAALDSPNWADHRNVSKHLMHHLNLQFGTQLAELVN